MFKDIPYSAVASKMTSSSSEVSKLKEIISKEFITPRCLLLLLISSFTTILRQMMMNGIKIILVIKVVK